jgi:hypothetical protein
MHRPQPLTASARLPQEAVSLLLIGITLVGIALVGIGTTLAGTTLTSNEVPSACALVVVILRAPLPPLFACLPRANQLLRLPRARAIRVCRMPLCCVLASTPLSALAHAPACDATPLARGCAPHCVAWLPTTLRCITGRRTPASPSHVMHVLSSIVPRAAFAVCVCSLLVTLVRASVSACCECGLEPLINVLHHFCMTNVKRPTKRLR